jgi:hypothetical protein
MSLAQTQERIGTEEELSEQLDQPEDLSVRQHWLLEELRRLPLSFLA